jgi:hypothetical protein
MPLVDGRPFNLPQVHAVVATLADWSVVDAIQWSHDF